MKTIAMLIVLLACVPSFAFGGEIYGTLTEDRRSVGPNAQLEVTCAGKTYPRQTTDQYGSYRLFVQEKGKCTLKVHYKQQSPSTVISSYDSSVRYDLGLEKKDGQYVLRRK
ncbi:MAG TPA: hypothetical protein VFM04_05175 [Candidatus Methylomirabilis sp.]|nr:hypothetical protein [Candidatus Methylomirabilis sp.]